MSVNKDIVFKDGFRKTGSRQIIMEVLEFATKPLSMLEITEMVNKKIPCDQATVYRNLKVLVDKEILSEKYFCHGHAHYEIMSAPHSHIVCKYCEEIEEIEDNSEGEQLAKKVFRKTKKFAYLEEFSMEIYGVCLNCVKKVKK
jgi:Fur family peroxide stress response transcriptional regulator